MAVAAWPLVPPALEALGSALAWLGSAIGGMWAGVKVEEAIHHSMEDAKAAEEKAKEEAAQKAKELEAKSKAQQGAVVSCTTCGGGDDDKNNKKKPKLTKNPKHNQNATGKASPEPSDASKVYEDAVEGPDGNWYGKNENGDVYRYSRPSNGETHWNGSSSGSNAIRSNNIPNIVKQTLGVKLR
jgi:cytochrome c553